MPWPKYVLIWTSEFSVRLFLSSRRALSLSPSSVNNVGRSHEMPVAFVETSLGEMRSIIDINVNGTLRVTQVVLDRMLQQSVLRCISAAIY